MTTYNIYGRFLDFGRGEINEVKTICASSFSEAEKECIKTYLTIEIYEIKKAF